MQVLILMGGEWKGGVGEEKVYMASQLSYLNNSVTFIVVIIII